MKIKINGNVTAMRWEGCRWFWNLAASRKLQSIEETDYVYDALDNLRSVEQCGGGCPSVSTVGRSFTYDGLSRLIQSFNPESGWICYGTAGGAVPNGSNCVSRYRCKWESPKKTDARNVISSYSYDALNRVLSRRDIPAMPATRRRRVSNMTCHLSRMRSTI